MKSESIAFIGTGVMGKSMAGHLINAGHSLRVHNRTPSKAKELIEMGATACSTPAEASVGASVVISIVGFPEDVESTYLGENGVFSTMAEGGLAIDMTTSKPSLAERIFDEAASRGISALDAPVSGGDLGARSAKLSIMVGGAENAFSRAKPLFDLMGTNVVYQGGSGAGQKTKMCNQIAIASGMIGVAEALGYAKKAGLDPQTVLKSIESGAAGSWSLSNLAPRALKADYAPGFFVKHFLKDLRIALESAEEMNLELPGLQLAERLYCLLNESGSGDCGTQALFRAYLEGA